MPLMHLKLVIQIFDKETATGIEIILRKTMGKVTGQVSAFHTKFDDYIFTEARAEDDHGDEEHGGEHELTHMEYVAVDAEFQGIEAEIDWLALENPVGTFCYQRMAMSLRKE